MANTGGAKGPEDTSSLTSSYEYTHNAAIYFLPHYASLLSFHEKLQNVSLGVELAKLLPRLMIKVGRGPTDSSSFEGVPCT